MSTVYDLDQAVRQRRSVRGFYPDRPVPREVLREILELSQWTPSNCNVQPWRVFVASGACVNRLRAALVAAVGGAEMPQPEDPVDTFPGDYRRLQVECAVALYDSMGIARDDRPGRQRALVRNFEFFDAPHLAVVCMENHFGLGVALDVGMWLQNFLTLLTSRGIGSCAQASLRMYPHILRRELQIPETLRIMCGVSFGYEDPSVPANRTRQTREPLEHTVRFLDD